MPIPFSGAKYHHLQVLPEDADDPDAEEGEGNGEPPSKRQRVNRPEESPEVPVKQQLTDWEWCTYTPGC